MRLEPYNLNPGLGIGTQVQVITLMIFASFSLAFLIVAKGKARFRVCSYGGFEFRVGVLCMR